MCFNLSTALITGASRGIGKDVALKFAQNGIDIVLNYIGEYPEDVVSEIESLGVKCFPFEADISDFNASLELVKKAKETFGSIDYLINNAGITKDNLLIRMSEEDFDSVININLKGTFNMTKHVSNFMLKQKSGSIVNVASVVGVTGNVGQANYAASKAGVIGLTKTTAKELAGRGITCNAVAPGFIKTAMTEVLSDDIKKKLNDAIPLKRLGETTDVSEAIYFLATNKYITGQVLNIDGGMVM